MCENSRNDCSSNGCGHTFCNTCWRGHLAVQIQDGQARHISCMAYKCGVVCDEELVAQVMKVWHMHSRSSRVQGLLLQY
jgi:ariadne-1